MPPNNEPASCWRVVSEAVAKTNLIGEPDTRMRSPTAEADDGSWTAAMIAIIIDHACSHRDRPPRRRGRWRRKVQARPTRRMPLLTPGSAGCIRCPSGG